jgi:glutaminyl-tRNA synthetase
MSSKSPPPVPGGVPGGAPASGGAGAPAANFVRNIVAADLEAARFARRHWCGRPGDGDAQRAGAPDAARIRTRFPPEPNGYLHLGHAKSIFLNFGLARDFGGRCHMRFDDTNPSKEEQEYVDAILDAVSWLGFSWTAGGEDNLYFASDYFEAIYRCAEFLVAQGQAYVDEQSADAMREARGTLTEAGRESPFRDRPVAESLRLLREMRAGGHEEGSMVLRARIDMASPNINLRDPTLYRIRRDAHHRTGDAWCIYPMYDYAHALSDALEGITHSICTLEFEDHRPLYEWCVERCAPVLRGPQWREALAEVARLGAAGGVEARAFAFACRDAGARLQGSAPERSMRSLLSGWQDGAAVPAGALAEFFSLLLSSPEAFAPLLARALENWRADPFDLPRQYEFSRLNVAHVVLSKRKLIGLVTEGLVDGWDDPRMPTITGLRRRGYTPQSMAIFTDRIGVSKADSRIELAVLEQALRDDLDARAPRATCVLDPMRLVLTNVAPGERTACSAPVHPHHPQMGMRTLEFGRELWIEREDFRDQVTPGFFRLVPGGLVRLRFAWVARCTGFERGEDGRVQTVFAEILPDTRSGTAGADSVKVKGAIHWLGAHEAQPAEVRLFEPLFTVTDPDGAQADYRSLLNPESRRVVHAQVERTLAQAAPDDRFQFERHGYFVADRRDHRPGAPVFNRIVTLKESRGR